LNATARSQLAKDFEEEQEFISLPLEEDFSIKPAIFRGHTAVCYDTGYYQHHVGSLSLLPKARRVYNTCFLQIRPQADLQKANGPVGFIQLQCCLPGLMNFLVPKSTSKDTDVLVLGIDKQLVATKGCEDNFKDVVLAEFANDWWESDKERRSLCTFWRLRELTHGWPRRLYNILDLGKRQAAILEKELVRREQHKYRQQLQLLDQPIDDLLSAVGLLQESSSQVYAIVREPSDAIFGIHHQVAPLFDENSGKLVVASDFSARIQHDPMEYDEKEEVDIKSLRSVVAMLLLKWTGYHKKTTTLTYLQFMTKASQWLDKCERDGKAYHWLLSQIRGVLLRPAPNATTPPQVDRMSDLLGTGYPFAALQQGACAAKSLLFTPFKLGASELGVLPVAIAAKLDHKKTFDIDRGEVIKATISDVAAVEEHLTLTRDISPALPKDIIQFIHGVVGEAFNRRQSLNVDALQIKRWYYEDRDINWQHIRITFSDSYLKGALKKLRGEVDSLLRADRDWRIEFGASGNFSAPFKTLANRLLGVGSEWFVSPTLEESDVFRLMNATSHNTFAVSSHDRCICLEWQKK